MIRRLIGVALLVLACLGAGSPRAAVCAGSADFDGDGLDDAVVTDPAPAAGDPDGWGHSYVLSGPMRNPRIIPFAQPGRQPGWTVKAGHLDDDGCLDVVISNPYAPAEVGGTIVPGAGAVYVYWGGPGAGRAGQELRAPTPRANAHFGWSLAIGSGLVGVGAPHEDADEITDSGAAYVFRFDGRRPSEAIRITQESPGVPGKAQVGDMFGWSMAFARMGGIAAEVDLAVGAPFEDREEDGQVDSGSVTLVYDVATRPWTYRGVRWDLTLSPQLSHTGDRFGYAVAFGTYQGKGYLAAGAPGADIDGRRDAGLVLLFESSPSGPRLARTLYEGAMRVADRPEAGDRFGHALAFLGTDLLIGVPGQSELRRTESGVVQAVPLDASVGSRILRLPDGQPYDHFGWSVSKTADGRVLVGVPDRGRTGAVATVLPRDGIPRLFTPVSGLEFGAAVSG
ncbi:FG-GAP repeat protein [Acrocarpospora catenulata]|uniref:FG-GAP repeat protein n=1 Tax=Acrocarpospora catenulata TaxID=2836182 RepID=UPI001BD9F305|nr:FG-GAP repeat protein [Acrocarpospora catenulata]